MSAWHVATYARIRPSRPGHDIAEYNVVDLKCDEEAEQLRGLQVCELNCVLTTPPHTLTGPRHR